jgi:predicted Fe-Mo cluster-binding NifX family protein
VNFKMKVAISVATPELDAQLDARFGRAAAFVIVDTETDEWQGYANPAANDAGGAGIRAAEFIVKQGAEAVISGAFGPNASEVLGAANVKMHRAESGTAAELVQRLKDGTLEKAVSGSGTGAGVGAGMGAGRGRGGRRGCGRGGRRGWRR